MTRHHETAGSVSGKVFAVSTIGSLLGALGTGFFLIPNFGVQDSFIYCGTVLLVLAVLGNFRPAFIGYALVLIALVVSLMIFTSRKPATDLSIEIIDESSGFYGQLQVIKKYNTKSLLVDGIGQNYVFETDYVSQYINFIAALPLLRGDVSLQHEALVVGLGAGELPMLFKQAGFDVEAVEIDPNVGDMAVKHFGFDLPSDKVHYMDGRIFLLKDTATYDYIVIDAFSAEQIAWHLISAEALHEAKLRLNDKGILAINFTSVSNGKDVAALQKTLKTVYPEVRTFSLSKVEDELTSIVFLASMSPVHLDTDSSLLNERQRKDAARFLANELDQLQSDIVLTDDFNPLSHQRMNVQLLWREAMIEYLGEDNLGWLLL
jgi:spermidine synthase